MNFTRLTFNFLFLSAIYLNSVESRSATINITNLGDGNVGLVSDNDSINFDADSTLNINSVKILDSVTVDANDSGTINFNTILNIKDDDLTILNHIGSSTHKVKSITFSVSENNLNAKGSLFIGSGAITTTVDDQGALTFSGASSQIISSAIGAVNFKLKNINISQSSGIEFQGDAHATNFTSDTGTGTLGVTGVGALNFTNSNFNIDTSVSTTSTNSLGIVTVADSKTLTLNEDATTGNIIVNNTSSIVNVATGKVLTIGGDVSGSGSIQSASGATVKFSSTAVQSVGSNVQFGTSSSRVVKIDVSHNFGLNLNGDSLLTTLDFTNTASTSTVNIAATKTLDIDGDITQTGAGNSVIKGTDGKLLLSGSSAQTISSSLGTSAATADRVGELEISNIDATGVTLNQDSFLKVLDFANSSNTSTLNIAATKTLDIDGDITQTGAGNSVIKGANGKLLLSGSAAQSVNSFLGTSMSDRLGDLEISNVDATGVTLNQDSFLKVLDFTNTAGTSTINIAATKTLDIDGDITQTAVGTSAIKGINGKLLLSGSSAQSVNSSLGSSTSDRLGELGISNVDVTGINLNEDSFLTTLDFANSSGVSTVNVAATKTLDIDGDITQSGAGSSAIVGAGTLSLSGSGSKTVNSAIGTSGNRLNNLNMGANYNVIFGQDVFLTNITLNDGNFSISGGRTIDVTNSIDLNGENVNFEFQNGDFGTFKTADAVNVNSVTKFVFNFSDKLSEISYDGSTQYKVVDAVNAMSGNLSDITVNDDSIIFDAILSSDGTDIFVQLNLSNDLNADDLVEGGTEIIENALMYSDEIGSELIGISSAAELKSTLQNLSPVATNGEIVQSFRVLDNNIINITADRIKTFSIFNNIPTNSISGFSSGNSKLDNYAMWGQFFNSKAKQSVWKGGSGYKSSSNGFIIGGDKIYQRKFLKYDIDAIYGAAFSKAHSTIKSHSAKLARTRIDSYKIIFYNNNSEDGVEGLYNDNILTIGLNIYDTSRLISVGSIRKIASANFNGMSYSAKSGVGYRKILIDKFVLSSFASLKYLNVDNDDYSETGAGSDGYYVKNKGYDNFVSELGFDVFGKSDFYNFIHNNVSKKFASVISKYEITPNFGVSWQRNLKNAKHQTTARFLGGGSDMVFSSSNLQRNFFNVSTGLNVILDKNNSFEVKYNMQTASKLKSHLALLRYRYEF